MKLPSFREKLLLPSHQEAAPEQRHASWQEAEDACYLQKERCTGLLSLKGAHYTVAGTVLVDSPGSGALLSVKAGQCLPVLKGRARGFRIVLGFPAPLDSTPMLQGRPPAGLEGHSLLERGPSLGRFLSLNLSGERVCSA